MRITPDGQITIPEHLLDRAGLSSGTEVHLDVVGDGIVLLRRSGSGPADASPAEPAAAPTDGPPAPTSTQPYTGKGAALIAFLRGKATTAMTSEEHLAIFGDED